MEKSTTNHTRTVIANSPPMNNEKILQLAASVQNLDGMTVNERLYSSNLMDEYDKAKISDKDKARFILKALKVDEESIEKAIK